MNHKEQARELFESFNECAEQGYSEPFGINEEIYTQSRKECAIIAVDLVIKQLDEIEKLESGVVNNSCGQDDWIEVKREIEKIK